MFIEKLKKEDIFSYYDKVIFPKIAKSWQDCKLYDIAIEYCSNKVRSFSRFKNMIVFNINNYTFIVQDFDFKYGYNLAQEFTHDKNWTNFMHSKFGDEYIKVLNCSKEADNQL